MPESIFFTEKLSKIVAHYENLRDMYIWIEHLFWHKYQLRLWQSEKGGIQYHGQDLLAEKTQSQKTLNDISSRNKVRASR